MKQFFEGIRRWSTLTEEQLLAEGRLDDAKKKFKNVDSDWIDRISERDPSGNNKYLMWAVKQFEKISEPWVKKHKDSGRETWSGENADAVYQAYRVVSDAMEKFHANSQRLKNRDINAYKTVDDVIAAIKKLGLSQKQKRRKKREQAKEGSTILEENDDFWLIRPDTTEASCYYGQGTKWCISATQSRNYFKQYTQEGKTFYMLMLKNLDDEDDGKKLALVYARDWGDGEPEEIYDAADDSIDEDDFFEHIISNFIAGHFADYEKVKKEYDEFHEDPNEETLTDNVKKIARELMNAGGWYESEIDEDTIEDPEMIDQLDEDMRMTFHSAKHNIFSSAGWHAEQNPGGPSIEDYEQMVQEADLSHIDVTIEDYGFDNNQLWWQATMVFDFELPDGIKYAKDEDGDETDFDYWEDEIKDIFISAADENYVYPDESEVYDERIMFTFRQDHDYNSDFEDWITAMTDIDGRYEDIQESAMEAIEQSEIVDDELHGEKLELIRNLQNMKNFDVSLDRGMLTFEQKDDYEMTLPLTRTLGIQNLKRVPPRGPGEKLAKSPDRDQFVKSALHILSNNMAKHQYLHKAFVDTWKEADDSYLDNRRNQPSLPLDVKEKPEQESLDESHSYSTGLGRPNRRTSISFPDFEMSLDDGGTIIARIRFEKVMTDHPASIRYLLWLDQNLDTFYDIVAKDAIEEAKKFQLSTHERRPELFEPQDVSENVSYGKLCEIWRNWSRE
tara:strand:- start:2251 stop:4440 length:2190 start_codon:yes stop_codon:yes gene_type:complete